MSNKSKRGRERRFIDGRMVVVERRPVTSVIGMRCERCGRKYRGRGAWNGTWMSGVLVGVLCPACQTPEENAEAEIHAATLDYVKGPGGMLVTRPKIDGGDA